MRITIRDEDLDARQAVALAVALGAQGERPGVCSSAGLGQRERGDSLTTRDRSRIAYGLLVGAGQHDRISTERLDRNRVLNQR